MDHFFDKGLVSIIMLSHGDGTYVVETVRSVLAQTYENSCVPMVASAASVERGIVVCGKNR
jgi:glycosyltransferase involved in cell wall biosynthesis